MKTDKKANINFQIKNKLKKNTIKIYSFYMMLEQSTFEIFAENTQIKIFINYFPYDLKNKSPALFQPQALSCLMNEYITDHHRLPIIISGVELGQWQSSATSLFILV